MRTPTNQTEQTNCGLLHQKNWSVDSELRQSMRSSLARPHEADNVSQRARIRARIGAAYNERPHYHERLAKRYYTQVKIPRPTKSSIQAAYEEFIGEAGQDIEIAVTLTFRDSALRMGGISARLNVEKTVRHYVNRLNKLAFGHGVGRRGQTLTVISVIEGEVSRKRLHAHLGISRPKHIDLPTWIRIALREATQCRQIGRQIDIKAITPGWIGYSTKEGPEALALGSMRRGRL